MTTLAASLTETKITRSGEALLHQAVQSYRNGGLLALAEFRIHFTEAEWRSLGRRLVAYGCPVLSKGLDKFSRLSAFCRDCVNGHPMLSPTPEPTDGIAGSYGRADLGNVADTAADRLGDLDPVRQAQERSIAERLQAVEDIASTLLECKPSWSPRDHVAGPSDPRERDISLFVREARQLVMKAVEMHYSGHRWAEWASSEVWEAASDDDRGCVTGFLHATRFIPEGFEVATDTGASEFFGDFVNLCLQGSPVFFPCPIEPEDTTEPETCTTRPSGHSSDSARATSPAGGRSYSSVADKALAALSNAPNTTETNHDHPAHARSITRPVLLREGAMVGDETQGDDRVQLPPGRRPQGSNQRGSLRHTEASRRGEGDERSQEFLAVSSHARHAPIGILIGGDIAYLDAFGFHQIHPSPLG